MRCLREGRWLCRKAYGDHAEQVVAREPKLLAVDLPAVLRELRRLLPKQDHLAYLASHPTLVLDMAAAGLPSTIDGDLMGGNSRN